MRPNTDRSIRARNGQRHVEHRMIELFVAVQSVENMVIIKTPDVFRESVFAVRDLSSPIMSTLITIIFSQKKGILSTL